MSIFTDTASENKIRLQKKEECFKPILECVSFQRNFISITLCELNVPHGYLAYLVWHIHHIFRESAFSIHLNFFPDKSTPNTCSHNRRRRTTGMIRGSFFTSN